MTLPELTMAPFAIIALGILFYLPFALLWKLRKISRSPLNAIPGPPSKSWVKGTCLRFCLSAVLTTIGSIPVGHVGELFGPDSERFRKHITEKYGKVVKLRGLFNVSLICSPRCMFIDAS